jgi:hypothetical protein
LAAKNNGDNGEKKNGEPLGQPSSPIMRAFMALKSQIYGYRREAKKAETEHAKNERMLAEWTMRLGQFTVVLAIVSIFGLGVSFCGLQETRETSQRQLRAYVGFDPEKSLVIDKGSIGVKVTARNYGQTPADEVQINAQGGVFHVPLLESEHIPEVKYLRGEDSSSVTILPGHESMAQTTIPLGYMVNDPRIQAGIADGTSLYIVGKATYYDAFAQFRFTDFCFIIKFEDLARVGSGGRGGEYASCPQRYTHSN